MKSKIFLVLLILLSACVDDVPTSPSEQLQDEVAAIAAYLEENPPGPGEIIINDASGVTLVISQLGEGLVPPDQNNELKVVYTGRLLSNGSVFDDTHNTPDEPLAFRLANLSVISGWKIALGLMTEGTIAKVYIPSPLAYGKSGKGSIPGNATLVFDMNLLSVNLTAEQESQLNTQLGAIATKLEGNENVVYYEGISLIHNQLGSGAAPSPYDQIEIKYSGRLLSDNSVFLEETTAMPTAGFSSRSINYLHGLNLAFQQMQEGGKATVYIPALLGYGPFTGPGVPANANLIYEIELTKVISQ